MKNRVVGVILAGGESRRFGSPKALAEYKGKSFLEYAYGALAPHVDRIVIVTHIEAVKKFQGVTFIEDEVSIKGQGPLAGIYSAMNAVSAEWYMTLPCDVPFMRESIISRIVEYKAKSKHAVIPQIGDRIQPLCSMYHHSTKEITENQLRNDKLSMKQFIERIDVNWLTEKELKCSGKEFRNINTIQDLGK